MIFFSSATEVDSEGETPIKYLAVVSIQLYPRLMHSQKAIADWNQENSWLVQCVWAKSLTAS